MMFHRIRKFHMISRVEGLCLEGDRTSAFSAAFLNHCFFFAHELTSLPMTEITYIRGCFAGSLSTWEDPPTLTHSLSGVTRLISCSASTGKREMSIAACIDNSTHEPLSPSRRIGACLDPKYNRVCQRGEWGGVGWDGAGREIKKKQNWISRQIMGTWDLDSSCFQSFKGH